MGLERFTRVQPQDNRGKIDAPSVREFVELCTRLERSLKRLFDFSPIESVIIDGIELDGTNPTSVAHGLGRPWRGWIVVSKSVVGNAVGEGTQTDRSKFLVLDAAAAQTISVLVF
jgi:hypothetical protein